jgi:hypothetical protein
MEIHSHFVISKAPGRRCYVGTGSEVGQPGRVSIRGERIKNNHHSGPSSFWKLEMDMASMKSSPGIPKVEEEFVLTFIYHLYWKSSVSMS